MINLFKYIKNFTPIQIKLNVPQVGSEIIEYKSLDDIPNNVKYDFIISNEGDLLIGKGHYKLNKKCKTLIFAGTLIIENGEIYSLDGDSGHYIPSDEEVNQIRILFKDLRMLKNFSNSKHKLDI